jgi:Cu/Ag efflux protein CusF
MKRTAVLFAAGVAALLFSGPAFAADKSGTSPSGTGSYSGSGSTGATAPAEKPGVTSMPHHVTGSVVSVDKKSNSVSIKDTKGKEMTLVADTDTAAELSRLKTGDEVKATYKKDKDQMVLTKIEIARARSSSTTK